MAWYHKVWHVVVKHWAYTAGSILCLAAVALLCAALGISWYTAHGHGFYIQQVFNQTDAPQEFYVDYTIREYILHLDFDVSISTYYGYESLGYSCHYNEKCYNPFTETDTSPGQPPWDLTKYAPTYAAIFSMTLVAIPLIAILGILLQVITWTVGHIGSKITLGLTIAAFVIVLLIMGVLLVDWCLLFNHPEMVRESLSIATTYCTGGDSDYLARYTYLCDWNGNWQGDPYYIVYDGFFYSDFRDLQTVWGPDTAWVLMTIAFGLVGFVLILVVGWWPSSKS